jgi:hypothetical protein
MEQSSARKKQRPGFLPPQVKPEEQEIKTAYSNLIRELENIISTSHFYPVTIGDPYADLEAASGLKRLVDYLNSLKKKLTLEQKKFVLDRLNIKSFTEKEMNNFISYLKTVGKYPLYYDEQFFSKIKTAVQSLIEKKEVYNFYKAIFNQISKKFYLSGENTKTAQDFIDAYLIEEGYLTPSGNYMNSKLEKIVTNYEKGKGKEYKELVKRLSNMISKGLELKEHETFSLIPKEIKKDIKIKRKQIVSKVSKAKKLFDKHVLGMEVEEPEKDVYAPKSFIGPPSAKKLYEKVAKISNVLGDETFKVKGVKDLGVGKDVDLNVHVFNNYKQYKNTLDCLEKAEIYCKSETPETQKVIPCILYQWNTFGEDVIAKKRKKIESGTFSEYEEALVSQFNPPVQDGGQGYIVTRDFSKYIPLKNIIDYKQDIEILENIEYLLEGLNDLKIYHGGGPQNILEQILIDPDTKDIVLVHFEECGANPSQDELVSQNNMFEAYDLLPPSSKYKILSDSPMVLGEEDVASLIKISPSKSKSGSKSPHKINTNKQEV